MNRQKILWLSHFVPYPPKGGAYQRSYNLLRHLAKEHEVHLLAIRHKTGTHPADELARAETELGQFCKSVSIHDLSRRTSALSLRFLGFRNLFSSSPLTIDLYADAGFRDAFLRTIREQNPDWVHFDTISLAPLVRETGEIPSALNHHAIESYMMFRRGRKETNWIRGLYYRHEGKRLAAAERHYAPQFVANLVVSRDDGDQLEEIAPGIRTEVIENGVDTDYFAPFVSEKGSRKLIFASTLNRYANKDAVLYFVKEVWPLLKREHPDLGFIIIGKDPPGELIEMASRDSSLEVLGFVDDVRPYFAKAAVCVCPIRDGAGTRLKVLDSMAMGIPQVSTTIGCEGLEVNPEWDILIADTPEEFTRQIKRILADDELRANLKANARKTVEDKYSWGLIGRKLAALYGEDRETGKG
jgi:glycosyltransferase involved in cell wall biosynthesis